MVPDRHALLAELAQREQRLAERLASRATQVRRVVDTATLQMISRMEYVLRERSRRVSQAEQLLRQLDPKMALRRGYSLVRNEAHTLIRGVSDVKLGETLTITTAHAIIRAGVIDATQK